jgi:protein-L-isoaspartate(D-aspartate) O-methyltransferase
MEPGIVQELVDAGTLRTPAIIAAFKAIDRADFVPEEMLDIAYVDSALPLGHGSTISQPSTVAFMLELLQPEEGQSILDVGAGSAWTTAMLMHIVQSGRVVATEIVPQIAEFGTRNLQKYYPLRAIRVTAKLGAPEDSPFDRILVSAAADGVPQELIEQLRVGGRMVIPVQGSIVKVDRVSESYYRTEEYPGFLFVPLRGNT